MIRVLKELYRNKKYGNPIIVVSGMPRSGTSMMMRMLEAGGIEIFTDKMRKADEDNTKGYYEFEKVKTLDKDVDKSWLEDARGKGIKIISGLVKELPDTYFYNVIFMNRNLEEMIASQNIMLSRRGEDICSQPDNEVIRLLQEHIDKVKCWLKLQSQFDVLDMSYNQIVNDPIEGARNIKQFLGRELCVEEMASAIDQQLYRNRS